MGKLVLPIRDKQSNWQVYCVLFGVIVLFVVGFVCMCIQTLRDADTFLTVKQDYLCLALAYVTASTVYDLYTICSVHCCWCHRDRMWVNGMLLGASMLHASSLYQVLHTQPICTTI